MKKIRILSIIIMAVVVVCCLTGCKKKELAPVYSKVSDNEITLLSQQNQYVELRVTIIDGENEMNFETGALVKADEVLSITLKDITDKSFFTEDAKISSVEIVKQTLYIGTSLLIFYMMLVGIGAAAIIIATIEIVDKKRRKRKIK